VRERAEWKLIDPSLAEHFEAISRLQRGDFSVIDRDMSSNIWIVSFISDDTPLTYYTYNPLTKEGKPLFSTNNKLDKRDLAQTQALRFNTRDGQSLLCYFTKPLNSGDDIPPAMVYVHDGPWTRDTWEMDPTVQWLADRGYSVLQVNYRGSSGFGKAFQNAGDKEWGGKMQNDITDAVTNLVELNLADSKRIGIIGMSYGGFAVLSGLTKTPDLFACGVDLFGPSNLISWIKYLPQRMKGSLPVLLQRIGKPSEDREMMIDRSPISHFDQLMVPLMIVQGAKDERVPNSETERIVNTLKANGRTVEYMGFPDEGHGFSRLENKLTCYASIKKFLAEHLGGVSESFSMTIRVGNDDEEEH
jgi:dipeptidyl aminopeptidase/acylaminoacyl peptidase